MSVRKMLLIFLPVVVFLMQGKDAWPQSLTVPDQPDFLDDFFAMVKDPEDIDNAAKELNLEPKLVNPYFATLADFSELDPEMGQMLYIPIQISEREGGRQSIHTMGVGESDDVAIVASSEGEAGVVRLTKISGHESQLKAGDEIRIEIRNLKGETVAQDSGVVNKASREEGHAEIEYSSGITSISWGLSMWAKVE